MSSSAQPPDPISRPTTLLAAAATAVSFCASSPVQVLTTNGTEIGVSKGVLVPALLGLVGLCWALLSTGAWLVPKRRQRILLTVFLSLTMGSWLQSSVLNWDYGLLDGTMIPWQKLHGRSVVDAIAWFTVSAGAFVFCRRSSDSLLRNVAWGLLSLQLALSIIGMSQAKITGQHQRLSRAGEFDYSSHTNVVFIVLDTLQSDIFAEALQEHSDIATHLDGFTYFRNVLGGYRESYPSIANMLTGLYYDNTEPMVTYLRKAFKGPTSLPKRLMQEGFIVRLYDRPWGVLWDPEVLSNLEPSQHLSDEIRGLGHLLDLGLFRQAPNFIKPHVYQHQAWTLARLADQLATRIEPSAERLPAVAGLNRYAIDYRDPALVNRMIHTATVGHRAPTFTFYHWQGIHPPVVYDGNLRVRRLPPTRDGLLEMTAGAMKLVALYLSHLKTLGVYDNTLVVLAADHGAWMDIGPPRVPRPLRRSFGPLARGDGTVPELHGAHLPAVLIKPLGARGTLRASDAPATLADLPKTVATLAGLDASAFPGVPMYDIPLHAQRPRRALFSERGWRQRMPHSAAYRPTMTEYFVEGHSWLPEAWRSTGSVFPPSAEPQRQPPPPRY